MYTNYNKIPDNNTKPIADELLIYPRLSCKSIKMYCESAFRGWIIARSIDTTGSGWINLSEWKEFLKKYEVNPSTGKYWLKKAVSAGWFIYSSDRSKLRILSIRKVCDYLEIKSPDKPVKMLTENFIKKGWHKYPYLGKRKIQKGLISQPTLAKNGYMSVRTQQRYLQGIKKRKNFYKTGMKADKLPMLIEYGYKSPVVIINGEICGRLPDTPLIPDSIAKRNEVPFTVNSRKHKPSNLLPLFQQDKSNGDYVKLFHNNRDSARSMVRKLDQSDIPNDEKPSMIFYPYCLFGEFKIWNYLEAK